MTDRLFVSLFRHKAWADKSMFDALEAVPPEQRGGIAMPLLVLNHTVLVDQVFKARLLGEAPAFDSVIPKRMPDLNELSDSVRRTDAWYVDYVGTVTDAELAQIVEFDFISDDDKGRMTKQEMLVHVLTHGAAHRSRVGQMLDGVSIRGPADMFTTFLRQER
jgi:uncharacterized damage-inducible protein DinB